MEGTRGRNQNEANRGAIVHDDHFQDQKASRKRGFPCCCMSWERDTWRGIGTVFSGMLVQASLGVASIWGNIVIYQTSKLRGHDPQLSLQFAIIIFPCILAVGSIAMQGGNFLMDRMNPRMQVLLGGIIWSSAIYCAQFPMSFTLFLFVYSVLGGIGFGIVYFVPLLCAWSYFPTKRNLVAGLILMCFSLNAIACSAITSAICNPMNDKPDIKIQLGKNVESFFSADSYQVEMLPKMWTRLSQIALLCIVLSLPLLTKKDESSAGKKQGIEFLDEAIDALEREEGYNTDDEDEFKEYDDHEHGQLARINSEVQIKKSGKRSKRKTTSFVNQQRPKELGIRRQFSTNSDRSSARARQSLKMRRSVESMGSSVKSATLSEDGVNIDSDLSVMTFRESFRDRTFWHIWMMITFSMMYAFFMKVAFKSYGSTIYDDDVYLTNTAKIGFFTAAVSRFGWAALQEVLGFKPVYMILLVLQLGLSFSMTSIAHNPTLYTIWVCTTWSCEGGQQSIFPPLAGQVYGTNLGVQVNALFFTGFGIAAVMGVVCNVTVVPALGWDAMFIILGCFTLISFIMLQFFKPVRSTFIPYDDERDFFNSPESSPTKNKQRKVKGSHDFESVSDTTMDPSSKEMLRKPLLFVQER